MATPFWSNKRSQYQHPMQSQMVLRVSEQSDAPPHITDAFKSLAGEDYYAALVEICVPFLFSRKCTLNHEVKWSQIIYRRNMTRGEERDEYAAAIDPSFRTRCAMLNEMAFKVLESGDVAEAPVTIEGVTRVGTRKYVELQWECKETIVRKSIANVDMFARLPSVVVSSRMHTLLATQLGSLTAFVPSLQLCRRGCCLPERSSTAIQ